MASTVTNLINTIDITFPKAGQDNDSQGFRDNFNIIRQSLLETEGSIESLRSLIGYGGELNGYITLDGENNLVVTAPNNVKIKPISGQSIVAYGAYGLTDSVTNTSTGTFAVDAVRNIQLGATIVFPNFPSTTYTVSSIDSINNYITVTPAFPDTPQPFAIGQALTFNNPVTLGTGTATLFVYGDIVATGNITAFAALASDSRLKTNVRKIDNALSKVKQISGVLYNWTDDYIAKNPSLELLTKQDTGVIAQDVQKVLPEVITTNETGYLGVRYEKLTGLIIEAIKELSAEVDEIKKKLQ